MRERLLAHALDWLGQNLYPVVFVGALIDASGLPFPGRLLLVAAGAMSRAGDGSVVAVIALASVAAMLVDHVWYAAGTWGSDRVLRLYRRLTGLSGGRGDPVVDYFARYGAATIVVGRFFTAVRALAWPLAAAHGVTYRTFAMLDVLGAAVWASLWVGLGWMVGEGWRSAADATRGWTLAIAGVALAVPAFPLVVRLARTRRAARASRGPARGPAVTGPGGRGGTDAGASSSRPASRPGPPRG